MVTVLASMVFAGISGSSTADTAAVGSILLPAMRRKGYDMRFAAALQAAGGAIGPVIPPSILMIVIGYVTGTSVAQLFLAGVVPGVLIGLSLMVVAYRQALKLSPAFTPALLNLADLYRANGLDNQAASLLQKAVTQSPDDPAAHYAMGLLLVRQKNLDEAVGFLEKAAELDPTNIRYSYVYAVALYENKRYEQAIAVLEAALQKQPANREIISALGSYYQQQGKDTKLQELNQRYTQ